MNVSYRTLKIKSLCFSLCGLLLASNSALATMDCHSCSDQSKSAQNGMCPSINCVCNQSDTKTKQCNPQGANGSQGSATCSYSDPC